MSLPRRDAMTTAEALRRTLEALDAGEDVAVVTVLDGPGPELIGRKLVVTRDAVAGALGEPELEAEAMALARAALETRDRRAHQVSTAGGTWRLYVELMGPAPELIIVGAGHIAVPLCRIGALVGFRVTVLDDRPEFARTDRFPDATRVLRLDLDDPFRDLRIGPETYVVLVTRAHRHDYECIRRLLKRDALPAYLGMIGSRRRVRAAFQALLRDGIEADRLESVRAPVGLDIGAETPEEIAVSIAAELVQHRRGGGGAPLSDQERVLTRLRRRIGEAAPKRERTEG